MQADVLLAHRARVQEEYRNLVEQNRVLENQVTEMNNQRSEIAKRCLNLQGQEELVKHLLAQIEPETQAESSSSEEEDSGPLALVR